MNEKDPTKYRLTPYCALNLPPDMIKVLDELRGEIPKNRIIIRLLEQALKLPKYDFQQNFKDCMKAYMKRREERGW